MRDYCSNPFKLPKHKKRVELRNVTKNLIDKACSLNVILNEDEKICENCRIAIRKGVLPTNIIEPSRTLSREPSPALSLGAEMVVEDFPDLTKNISESKVSSSSEDTTIDNAQRNESIQSLNKALIEIGETPITSRKLRSSKYKQKKTLELSTKIGRTILGSENESSSDGLQMIDQFREKMHTTQTSGEKYLILTSLPKSWTIRKIETEFNVSFTMARRAKKLVAEKGVMSTPHQKLGSRRVEEGTVQLINDFYYNDDNSRACAGQREYVTVNENGEKIKKQRRLLLMNLNEAYELFKESNPQIKIGRTKFIELRPRECILALDKCGTHSVCVCMYHQNIKLIFEPLKKLNIFDEGVITYKDLLRKLLCCFPTENCYINKCEKCPGSDPLEEYLATLFEETITDDLNLKQWFIDNGM